MEIINILALSCPVPNLLKTDNTLNRQENLPQICEKVCRFDCVNQTVRSQSFVMCKNKFNFIHISLKDHELVLLGFILRDQNELSRKKKKRLSSYIVSKDTITSWITHSNKVLDEIDFFLLNKTKEIFESLHDIKTGISLIFRNTESLIYEEQGNTFDEKVENAPPDKKALFKSVSLLEERIKMMDLISNPSAASHGQKRPTPVYRVIDKFVKLYSTLAYETKKITLRLHGTSFNSPHLYESFGTIPLVLIDNAIKYSLKAQEITLKVQDLSNNGAIVSISSLSPRIGHENIFDKGVRGKYAPKIARMGQGLGLYLAKVVAEANGFEIQHSETNRRFKVEGIEYTENIFSFTIYDNV